MMTRIERTIGVAWLRAVFGLKGEARRSHLGLLWWLLEPILLFSIYSLVFRTIGGGTGDISILIITGLIPWIWTARTCQNAAGTLVSNKGPLLTVDLPILVFPIATVFQDGFKAFFVYIIGLTALFALGADLTPNTLLLTALVFIVQLLFLIGVAPVISLIGAVLPDFRVALPALLTALMFGSEIFYSRNDFHGTLLAKILYLNPVASNIHLLRSVVNHDSFELDVLAVIIGWTILLWVFTICLTKLLANRLMMFLLR